MKLTWRGGLVAVQRVVDGRPGCGVRDGESLRKVVPSGNQRKHRRGSCGDRIHHDTLRDLRGRPDAPRGIRAITAYSFMISRGDSLFATATIDASIGVRQAKDVKVFADIHRTATHWTKSLLQPSFRRCANEPNSSPRGSPNRHSTRSPQSPADRHHRQHPRLADSTQSGLLDRH